MCVSMYEPIQTNVSVLGGQKKVSSALELELVTGSCETPDIGWKLIQVICKNNRDCYPLAISSVPPLEAGSYVS